MSLSFLVLILVPVRFFVLFLLDESSLHQARLKLTVNGLLGDILVLLLVEVFSVGVWESLLVLSLCFLMFKLLNQVCSSFEESKSFEFDERLDVLVVARVL